MINLNKAFESKFLIEPIEDLPVGMPTYYFPDTSTEGGSDGPIVKVTPPGGTSWVGIFAFGQLVKNGLSGLYPMPDQKQFCVVANGRGYIVDAGDHSRWEELMAQPITDVREILDKGMIIFANLTEITAYDSTGKKWTTKRLALEGFKIVDISSERIVGKYYDIRSEADNLFEVDLASGEVKGGIE